MSFGRIVSGGSASLLIVSAMVLSVFAQSNSNKVVRSELQDVDDGQHIHRKSMHFEKPIPSIMFRLDKNGSHHGYWYRFHDDGTLKEYGSYVNGQRDGWWYSFFSGQGQKLSMMGRYSNGKREGDWTLFSPDERVVGVGQWKAGIPHSGQFLDISILEYDPSEPPLLDEPAFRKKFGNSRSIKIPLTESNPYDRYIRIGLR